MSDAAQNTAELFARAEWWLSHDPDPETQAELQELITAASGDAPEQTALAALQERFSGRLAFGTAGLRAALGAGPRRMNRVVVAQTTAGFASFLRKRQAAGIIPADKELTVVIGFDARKNSEVFARDAARVIAGHGIRAVLLPGPLPTPVTAFAVRHLDAAAGIMITASHNPPADNGYKVYLGDRDSGSQIIPPDDAAIAAEINAVAETPFEMLPAMDRYETAGTYILTEYLAALSTTASSFMRDYTAGKDLPGWQPKVVYTAMHGVGAELTRRAVDIIGLQPVTEVAEQIKPDPDFPTVAFPNPEEAGALDLAYLYAANEDADIIIAQDPDADRLAVAAKLPDDSGYRALTGNQLGLLLGWQAAENWAATPENEREPGALACTIVSSPALSAVAAHYGLEYAETLSGFKWVSRVPKLIFGFEEALGYLVNPAAVRDKDGISATVAALELVCRLGAEGKTLWDQLDAAAAKFGQYDSTQLTVRFDTPAIAAQLMDRLRAEPPQQFGSHKVSLTSDLLESANPDMRANVLRYDIAGGSRIMVRPSGTEPKLKLYIDAVGKTGTVAERKTGAAQLLNELRTAAAALLEKLQAA